MQCFYSSRRWASLSSPQNVLLVVLLCFPLFDLSSPAEIGVIGVLTEMTNPTKCDRVIPTSVYPTESLRWLTNLLNSNNYTNDVKLEIDVMDICESKSSISQTIQLLNRYKTGPKKLIGILSMTSSAKMLNVSWFLSSLPSNLGVIQIGTTETAYQLNDRTRYPTFFRVVPDDGYQFQLIAKLLKQLQWNYIAILHEKDVYGEDGAELLSKHLPALGITLAAKIAFDDFNEQLFILGADYSKVQSVVVIAQTWTLQKVSIDRIKRFRFILTESASVDDSFANLKMFENSFAVMSPQISFPSLETHWENLFNYNHMRQDEVFLRMIRQNSGCPDVFDSKCNLTQVDRTISKKINKSSVLAQLVGLYTFATLVKKQTSLCNNCPLSTLKLKDIQNQIIDFSYLSEIFHYPPMNLSGRFNEKGNLVYPTGFIAYKVYNNMKNDTTGRFAFQEVGQFIGEELELNKSALHDLEMWGVCPIGKNCHTCSGEFSKFLYREGDIMLFGIVPVRSGTNAETCPCYENENSLNLSGSQLAEAMIYAVEQLNQKKVYKNLFPGKKLGIVIMDSCNQQIPAFKTLLSFWRGTADICKKEANCQEIADKTLVYIGGMQTEVTIRISQLMAAKNAILMSYGATSAIFRGFLSTEHEHFIRLTPSNDFQIEAMIDICVKMKWLYVSLIYANNEYGLSAQKELFSKSNSSEICITQSLLFEKGDLPTDILGKLRRRPDAKVVIVFINPSDLEKFMTPIAENMEVGEFTFLGSESWGNFLKMDRIGEKMFGSLSLEIDVAPDPAFQKYLDHTEMSQSQTIDWSLAAMENQCYLNLSLNKLSLKPCPANMTLSQLGKQHLFAPLVIQTVYAAALGLNEAIAQICDTVEVCPNLFKKSRKVVEIFKQVKLKDRNGNEKKVFNDFGDGTLSYAIYNIQVIDKECVNIKIGHWSNTSGLVLDTKQIDVPPVNCPNQKRCSECPTVQTVHTPSEKLIPAVVFFVLLLLLLVAILVIFIRLLRIEPESNERTTNDLNKNDDILDTNIACEDDSGSKEDNISDSYMSIADCSRDSDSEDTDPKQQYQPEHHTETYPKILYLPSSITINPAFEADDEI